MCIRDRHEAAQLQRDLVRADIHPFAWVINQSLLPLAVTDPVLVQRRAREGRFHDEVRTLSPRVALIPWTDTRTSRLELLSTADAGLARASAAQTSP